MAALLVFQAVGAVFAGSAPSFTVTDIYGSTFSLSNFGGRVVLLEFFTTWCGYCKSQISYLKEVASYFGSDVVIIGLSYDDDSSELWDYAAEHQISWIIAPCSESLMDEYDAQGVPNLFIIDSQGDIVFHNPGLISGDDLISELNKYVQPPEPEPEPEPEPTPEPEPEPEPEPTPEPEPEPFPEPVLSDSEPPVISIIYPQNDTYSSSICTGDCTAATQLTFNINEPTSWVGYIIDGQTYTIEPRNTTISGLLDGCHKLFLVAYDLAGNYGVSETVYFTIDTTPPQVVNVSQTALNLTSDDEIQINATVIDTLSEVKQVVLNYSNCIERGVLVNMTSLENDSWSTNIPAFPYCETAEYSFVLEDAEGNTGMTELVAFDQNLELDTEVIPEFSSWLILPIFLVASLAVTLYKKKLFSHVV